MESVLLLLADQLESGDPPHQGPQVQLWAAGRLPGDKRHPPGKLQHHFGVELIGLGTLQQGFGEVSNGARIGHHDLDPFSPMKSQSQIEAIKTGCFNADLHRRCRLAQPLNQSLVPDGRIEEFPPLAARLVVALGYSSVWVKRAGGRSSVQAQRLQATSASPELP